ncbi:MAG: YfiR family protein [Vicinamibacterales bacterium]
MLRYCLAAFVAAVVGVSPSRAQDDPAVDESRLKAAFVFRFPQFVEWPEQAIASRPTLDICITRPNPFGTMLDELVAGETLNGRQLVVRQVGARESPEGCGVLYISGDGATASAHLTRASGQPVLTVGDSPTFIERGGIIRLLMIDRRVRFEIGAAAAERAGLRLSSQLMRLAVAVHGVVE